MSDRIATLGIALNAQGAQVPEWIQLTPAAPVLTGNDGRRWAMSDPQGVIARTKAQQSKFPLDVEHATEIKGAKGERADAVGWLTDFEVRGGAIWGRVDWLEEGRAIMSARSYAFISPVFFFDDDTREVVALTSAALTNQPNFNMPALNRAGASQGDPMDKDVIEALGLSEGATPQDAVAAIGTLKGELSTARNRAETPDVTKFVPRSDYDLAMNRIAAFERAETERKDAEITAVVDQAIADGKIAPANKEYHMGACRTEGGLEGFKALVEAATSMAEPSGLDGKSPTEGTQRLTAEERAMCRQMNVSEEAFLKTKQADEEMAA
ncbi:MAG: phage protease [Shimia sp.]